MGGRPSKEQQANVAEDEDVAENEPKDQERVRLGIVSTDSLTLAYLHKHERAIHAPQAEKWNYHSQDKDAETSELANLFPLEGGHISECTLNLGYV